MFILPDPYYKRMKIWMVSGHLVMQEVLSNCSVVVIYCGQVFVENISDCEVWDCRIYREQVCVC